MAEELSSCALSGIALDERLIAIEQSVVQECLMAAKLGEGSLAYMDLLQQLNQLLNQEPWKGSLHLNPQVRWYSRLLRRLRRELGGSLNFALQSHREAIGLTVTTALRSSDRLGRLISQTADS